LNAIDSVQQETGIVIDESEKIELLQAQRNGAAGFELLNQIVNYIISVVITGHTSSMENSRYGGTYAQARATTSEIREILLYDLATDVDSVVNRQLFFWWYTFNYPRTREFARQQILPPRPRESANQVPESEALSNPYVSSSLSFSESAGSEPQDKLFESALDESLTVFEQQWIDPLRKLIRDADSPEDARVKLELYRPDDEPYIDLLHRTFVSAHVAGRWHAKQTVTTEEQFAETLSDREITRLLESPILVSKAREIVLQKALMSKREFNRLEDSAKRKAFTVSGVENERIMVQVRQAVADAIQEGASLRDIERAAMDAFHRYGVTWQTPYHAQTVFRTNIESAFADAQWAMIQDPDVRDQVAYLEYLTEADNKVRPSHRKMHGVIRPVNDSIWLIWWPPNGYNCRCRIRIITREEAQRRNILPTPTLPDVQPDPGFRSGPGTW
jgi:SPP1 gp7 family putative phage head morphogenesis protein